MKTRSPSASHSVLIRVLVFGQRWQSFYGLLKFSVDLSVLPMLKLGVFRKKYWNLILAWEGQTDPRKTSADRRMVAVIDGEELETRKASQIPQNTRINTSWAVRVWSEGAEERNGLIQIISNSETIPQVNPEILNITDKDELNYRLSKFVFEV